ncbi:unnamed protein product [Lactuca saligna]|uniref:Uncharacterized protein n=1 Tax=Lactuca saligna TaxID=75948 RepID=A0AA35ZTT2_LACSI|nr:unnamed protein product [Lactuca saligna]
MFLRTDSNDGFEDYCFEGADAEATFRSPHTPHTPMAPNTPLTSHGSASRGISGGHDSNTKYRWHSQENENIFDAFKCVLKDRYRDKMKEKWQKNSKIAQQNRNTADSNGSTARHTAGSIGFDQHRRKLEKLMGKPPTHYDVFMKTHGTAESKKKYFEGNHENLEYCSRTAKEALEAYTQGWSTNMVKILQTITMM